MEGNQFPPCLFKMTDELRQEIHRQFETHPKWRGETKCSYLEITNNTIRISQTFNDDDNDIIEPEDFTSLIMTSASEHDIDIISYHFMYLTDKDEAEEYDWTYHYIITLELIQP